MLQLLDGSQPESKMTQNRKRGRNVHEDEIEFMPLSKRINNLHINNPLLANSVSVNSVEWCLPYGQNLPPGIPTPPEPVQSLEWTRYNPELSESENPYYYSINKLLYEMYVERQQRARNPM